MTFSPTTAPPAAGVGPRSRWLGEEQIFFVLAIILGAGTGLAVVAFRLAIDRSRAYLLGPDPAPGLPRVLLAPALAGLVIGILAMLVFPRVRGSGVNQTKGALYVYDGYIPFRTVIGKFVLSALAIGSGQSLGPEDPSLQIGAGLASLLGRKLRLSREKLRLIAPVGAAAGLAAAFNAPITAVLFVIEEVIGRWSAGTLGAVVLAAVSSVVVERSLLGEAPLFQVPSYSMRRPLELLAYAALGVAGGVAGVVFQKLIGFLRPRLKNLPRWTQYFQPALAGLLIGAIGIRLPQVMGAGYDSVDAAMRGQFAWQLLGILAGMKILSTTLSFSSGTPGGLFAPTLFVGAMLGGCVGGVERLFLPHLTAPVGAYALVGIGTLFASFLRAPMTSVFMVLEVSGDYSIILPVMVCNTIAYLISRAFQRTPIFDLLSQQDGLHLPSMEEAREMQILRVEEAMRPPSQAPLDVHDRVSEALARADVSADDYLLITDSSGKWYGLLKESLNVMVTQGKDAAPLAESEFLHPLPHVHPDHPLNVVLRRIDEHPLLPVVHRANLQQLVGVISLADIVAAYRKAGAPVAFAERIAQPEPSSDK
jgi:chloride channel protein, CIC family